MDRDDNQLKVSFVKITHNKGVFKWPDKPDIAWIMEKDIVKKLGTPITHNVRMGYIKFEGL